MFAKLMSHMLSENKHHTTKGHKAKPGSCLHLYCNPDLVGVSLYSARFPNLSYEHQQMWPSVTALVNDTHIIRQGIPFVPHLPPSFLGAGMLGDAEK